MQHARAVQERVMAETIAFIGVGTMGQSMARNLALKGFRVTGFDVNPAALDAAVELGIEPAQSAAAAGASADIAITMLPNSPHEEAAVLGSEGLFAGLRKGSTFIQMSTIDPNVTRR